MGQVFGAIDLRLDRPVALKFLDPRLVKHPVMRGLLEREARAVCRLGGHPSICTVHELYWNSEPPFLVMELLAGETLAARLARGPLSVEDAVAIGLSIVDGLVHAHSRDVIHRDLKPGNLMLTPFGPKLFDFGIAKRLEPARLDDVSILAPPGAFVGSASYCSPEQAEGLAIDSRSDIFSVGCVLYEMVTGIKAFDGTSRLSILSAVLRAEPREIRDISPSVPLSYARIVGRCLEKDPAQRFQRTVELHNALDRLARSGVAVGPPVADSYGGTESMIPMPRDLASSPPAARTSDAGTRSSSLRREHEERSPPLRRQSAASVVTGFLGGEAPFCLTVSTMYGAVIALTLLLEVAYRWDQFSDWVVGAAVAAGLSSAIVGTSVFELMRRRVIAGRPRCLATATGLFCLWSGVIAVLIGWHLPSYPIVESTIQTMPARVGWGKGVLEALVVPTLSLLPLHAVFALRHALGTPGADRVRRLFNDRSASLTPGMIVPEPRSALIVFAVVAIVWIGMNKGFIESVKQGPYSALFMALLLLRAAVGLLSLLGVALWYARRFDELKYWASEA